MQLSEHRLGASFLHGTYNINFVKPAHLDKQKRICVFSVHGTYHWDCQSSCQTQKHPAERLLGLWNFPLRNPSSNKMSGRNYFI